MFRCLTDKGNFCLAPTAEEAIVAYARNRLTSYKQLPVIYFQIGEKFRNEIRTRGFLLRGKAFEMMDAYSFGSIGGNKSEEFMCVSEIGEDNILFDGNTGKAFNSELLDREDYQKYLKDTYGITDFSSFEKRKAVELGHIFQLGDKYAKTMNGNFVSQSGKVENYIMGCYGIGVSRTLAMIYENSIILDSKNNFNGISLPINEEKAIEIYNLLIEKGITALYDDRSNISIGAKIKDSKILGTPYFAVFGKTLDEEFVEIENNKTGEKINVNLKDFVDILVDFQINKEKNLTLEDSIQKQMQLK